jgi:hypothetical protein
MLVWFRAHDSLDAHSRETQDAVVAFFELMKQVKLDMGIDLCSEHLPPRPYVSFTKLSHALAFFVWLLQFSISCAYACRLFRAETKLQNTSNATLATTDLSYLEKLCELTRASYSSPDIGSAASHAFLHHHR